ncbi:hypothetical protein TIFTF001_003408 [Ficus carica]|uniref:Uncharacterized protein n=1 Tax=Ficus carica TaxID=3494 RepID=A0AA87ZZH5_FICCA|nr:hypothetical protein TIFTF001_003408 [Ficus carica]
MVFKKPTPRLQLFTRDDPEDLDLVGTREISLATPTTTQGCPKEAFDQDPFSRLRCCPGGF